MNKLKQLINFNKYLLPYWDKELVLLLCNGFKSVFGLVTPYIAKLTIDYAYGNKDLILFNVLILIGIIFYAFSNISGVIEQYLQANIRFWIDFRIRSKFYRHFYNLPLNFFQNRSTGEHMYRIESDVEDIVSFITQTFPNIITTIFRLFFLLIITYIINWKLTLVCIIVAPFFYLHSYYFGNKRQKLFRETKENYQQIYSTLHDALLHIKLTKAFGKTRFEVNRYLRNLIEKMRLNTKNSILAVSSGQSGAFLNTLFLTGISYFMGYQIIKGTLTLGSMAALTMYIMQLMGVLRSLGDIRTDLVMKFVSVERFMETFGAMVKVENGEDAIHLNSVKGQIEFKDVTFGYQPNKTILNKISFKIEPSMTVALVGPSGTGKTTIVNLLLRLYDPWDGSVLIDGYNMKELALETALKQLGVVLQETSLINGTVRDNITYANPFATEDEVIQAAEIAEACSFISDLPFGYDTKIGERGYNLSRGQRQRIAIARAVLQKPKILILDEATSSLNLQCEEAIYKNLISLDNKPTIIVISHKLPSNLSVDLFLTIENGQILQDFK